MAPLHKRLVAEGGIAAVKAALDRIGLYGGVPRSPLQPADEARLATVDAALEAAALEAAALGVSA